jgi:hypothetical protein
MLTIKLLDIVIGKFYTLIKRVPNIWHALKISLVVHHLFNFYWKIKTQ